MEATNFSFAVGLWNNVAELDKMMKLIQYTHKLFLAMELAGSD